MLTNVHCCLQVSLAPLCKTLVNKRDYEDNDDDDNDDDVEAERTRLFFHFMLLVVSTIKDTESSASL